MRRLLLAVVILAGCSSPPPPRDDFAVPARISALEVKLDERDKERANLLLRIAALEATVARKPKSDDDVAARIAAIETKLGALEDKVAFLELARDADRRAAAESAEKPPQIVDRRRPQDHAAPDEVVKPVVVMSGEMFSFVRQGKVDVARLAGVAAPARDDEPAATKARERIEDLLKGSELRLDYPDTKPAESGAAFVYARAKKPDGSEVVVNEVLLREGLVRAAGEHPRRAEFEKLEGEAKAARRGIFGR